MCPGFESLWVDAKVAQWYTGQVFLTQEHSPEERGVAGSNPALSTSGCSLVVKHPPSKRRPRVRSSPPAPATVAQYGRALARQARGHGFKSRPLRRVYSLIGKTAVSKTADLGSSPNGAASECSSMVERLTDTQKVGGSNPSIHTCRLSSTGRATHL